MITPVPLRGLALALALLFGLAAAAHASPHRGHEPGTLANPGFEGQPMKSVFFFAGQWRFVEAPFYSGPTGQPLRPVRNDCLYTQFPVDGFNHLGWSDNQLGGKRDHVLNMMLEAGVNVVSMSHWGLPSHDRWAFWAPMQTAPQANDELFDAALGKPMLIAPYIENSDATEGKPALGCFGDVGEDGTSPGFHFADVFPGTRHDPAPELVEQIVALVNRYLHNPEKPEWAGKWARMYDGRGRPRYIVSLLHVGSNQMLASDHQAHRRFAEGFTRVADRVHDLTGVHVGFTLDVLPQETPIAKFKPTARDTGPRLARESAVLAIQSFIPEIHTRQCLPDKQCDAPGGSDALKRMLRWKRDYVREWVRTGIPVILDVSPGYDGKLVNDIPGEDDPPDPQYGNNEQWREGQASLLRLGVRGITGNSWNGYTEGMAIVPSCSPPWGPPGGEPCPAPLGGQEAYLWFQSLALPEENDATGE
jgi:hypothetical protein